MTQQLTNNLPYLLLFLLIVGLLAFLVVAYLSGASLKGSKHPRLSVLHKMMGHFYTRHLVPLWGHMKKLLSYGSGPINESVKSVKAALKEDVGGKNALYGLPWYAIIGDKPSRKEDLLKSLDLSHPLESPRFGLPEKDPLLSWWFFEKGIVLDVAEKCLYEKPKGQSRTDWLTLLKSLARHRSKCPLDGLILTVPASYFYGPNKLSAPELKKRAKGLSDQLLLTEKYLGLKLPLYVLVTGCESLAGFRGFCQEIPQEAQQEMFGWSSGFSTEVPYKSHWIEGAFKKLKGFLFESVITTFSKGSVEEYGDDMMVFLKEFSKLEGGLKDYLDTLFRVTDYKDHFILRGLYATGEGEEAPTALPAMDGVPTPIKKGSWFFLKDLFQNKIFPEKGVALPIKRFIRSTNRVISYLKIATIAIGTLSLFSLYFGRQHLTRAISEVQPSLAMVLQDLQLQGGKNLSEEFMGGHAFERRARTILDLVSKTARYPLATPLLLPSLVSGLDDHLYQQIFNIYNMMIAMPMHVALSERAERIMKTPLPTPKSGKIFKESDLYEPTRVAEFITLAGYVDEVATLEDRASLYNSLRQTRSRLALEKVIRYLYGFSFSKDFAQDTSEFTSKLIGEAHYRPFNVANYRLHAEKRLYRLYNAFLERVLDPEYIYRLTARLQESLEEVDGRGTPDMEKFYQALLQIKDVVKFASPQGAKWLSNPELDFGGLYQNMIEKLEASNLFGDHVPQKLRKVSEDLHEKALHYLKSYGSPLTGYFFTTSVATKKLEPSQGLLTLEKGLGLFLHKPFMAKVDGEGFARTIPKNQLLHWDRRLIQNAITLIESYEDFVEEELPGYPADLQDTLRVVGLKQTQRNVEKILDRAQTFFEVPAHAWGKQAEDAARLQVDNVKYVGPLLLKLISKLDGIGSTNTYSDLRNIVFEQMFQNLRQLDKTLMEGGYYMPLSRDFSWWTGGKGMLLRAYGMMDKHEMRAYFENQTQHIMHMIKEYAAPVMQVLHADIFTMNIQEVVTVARWKRLLEEAVAFEQKKVGGSLKALETFLVDEGNDITQKDCFEKISPEEAEAQSGDFFYQKRNEVRRMVFEQCKMLNADVAARQYNEIANYFNAFMAGTFPFMEGVPDGSKISADVSDQVLKEFFTLFDKLTAGMRRALRASESYKESWEEVGPFLSKMRKIRAFTDKYFAPKTKEGDPGVDFVVEFRQNKMREKHADKVLDWAFVVGDTTTSVREGSKKVRWEFGKNVAIGFQWAMDAPLKPIEEDQIPALIKVGGRSMYVYQGYWSLLRAMMIHKTAPQEGGSTRNNTLLKFVIPVAPNPMMQAVDNALLFLRIIPQTSKGLSDPAFKIPDFPVEAPRLYKTQGEEG